MKKADVQIGERYVAKVSGTLTTVRIDRESPYGGWDATNVDTGRRVRIKSAQRLRRPARKAHPERDYTTLAEFFPAPGSKYWPKKKTDPEHAKAIAAADQENARLRDEREQSPDGMTASERAMAQSAAIDERIAAAPPSIVPYEVRRARAEAAQPEGGTTPLEDLPEGEARDAAYDPDVCATVGCNRPVALTYLGRPRCQECYEDDVADGDATSATTSDKETDMATTKSTTGKSATKTTKAPKAARPAGDAKPKRVSALDAAAQVLAQAGRPMRAKELIEAMVEQGLWSSPAGKTPEATIYAAIIREIATRGDVARFRKADRGQFEFNAPKAKE